MVPNSSQAFYELPTLASSAVDIATLPVNHLSTLLRWLLNKKAMPPQQETLASRTSRVSRIRITPFKLVGYINETQTFAAVGLDANGEIVHGAKFTWESEKADKISIDEAGRASFLQPGQTKIIARAGSASAEATVLVRPIRRPRQTDHEWKNDQDSLQVTESSTIGMLNLLPSLLDKFAPTAAAQGTLGSDMGQSAAVGSVGNPRYGVIEPTRLGAVLPQTNFNMGIPLVSLGGRGLAANLALYYNSNVWGGRFDSGTNTTYYTFDPIQSWPSPGFTLGFGRIAYYDWQYDPTYSGTYALMLIDPDGTRHLLGRVAQSNATTVQTTDGTHITYIGSVTGGGTLYFQNGMKVTIGFVNNRLLPTQIIESNGNYIQIAYKLSSMGFSPLAIDSVTDTLGRVIQFNYSGTTLISVNPPSGTPATFNYQTVSMNTDFQNVTVENVGANFQGINSMTSANRPPATFTYSGYGMIYNVGWASGGLTGSVAFNYPTGGEALTGGPTFTQRTETATNSPTGVYSYADSFGTSIITRPDGTKMKLTPGGNGIAQSELTSSTNVTFAKSVYAYANDPSGSPQVQSMTSYDETNTATKVDFDHDQYGNVTNKREYGEKIGGVWKVRRRTLTTYIPYQQYIDAYQRSLPMRIEVFDALENTNDADDVLVQKTEYQYDGGTLVSYPGPYPPGYSAGYVSAARGNQTGTTGYTSLAGGGTSITHTNNFDIFGNTVKTQVACCNEQSMTFGENTYWSQAEQMTKGATSGIHLTSSMVYNFTSGALSQETDPNGQITSYSYGSSGLLTGSTLPTSATTSFSYNAWGAMTSSARSYVEGGVTKNITTSTVYNGFGQPVQTINQHGGQVNIAYNNMGRMSSRTNPFPQGGTPAPATTFTYDVLGRTTVMTLPGGNTKQTTYSGKVTTYTDQVNRKSKHEVDSLGRLIKATEQNVATGNLTQETNYTYDIADHLLQVNQGNQFRKFKYDAAGRVMFEKIPEQIETISEQPGVLPPEWTAAYTYTDFGAVATKTDARGVITTNTYDTLNRLISESYNVSSAPGVVATPTVTYNYDNNQTSETQGLLLSVSVGSNYTESYSYNVGGGSGGGDRLTLASTTYTIDSRNYTVNYQYNNADQITQVGDIYYDYDLRGRLQGLKNVFGVAWMNNLTYNAAGQMTSDTLNTSGTVVNETFGYDTNRLQLTSQTATRGATSLMNLTYSYSATAGQNGTGSTAGNSGQLMSMSGTINSTTESSTYSYDLLMRITTSSQTTNSISAQRRFSYDRWGNRTSVYDATSGGNQIQSIALQQSGGAATNRITSVTSGSTTRNYTYDAAGNVTNDGVNSYQLDAENRVVTVNSGTTATYAYNYGNQRVKKVTGGATTHYVWEGSRAFAEYNGATGTLLVQYINANNRMVAKIESGVTRYVLSDRLSARVVLDGSGNVIGRQGHLPFGEEIGLSGTSDKHRFTNYARDSESGLDYAVNRTYAPIVGRFNQSDPYKSDIQVQIPQSWNRYSYVINSPTTFIDPLGLNLEMPNSSSECETIGQFFSGSGGMPVACIKVQLGGGPKKVQDQCEVKVRWRRIDGIPGTIGWAHLYVLLQPKRAAKLVPYYHGAGPTKEEDPKGDLKAGNGFYGLDPVDFTKRRDFSRNYAGEEARTYDGDCEKFQRSMQDTMVQTNNAKIPYAALSNNSNRYVYTLLLRAGILNDFNDKVEARTGGGSLRGLGEIPGWGESLPLP